LRDVQVKPLLEMVRLIRDCQASETLPVLVHCSAGCGRTGTICAIDFVWGLLRTGKLTADFSLYNLGRFVCSSFIYYWVLASYLLSTVLDP
jgi:protein tyrosine phosphatase